MRAVRPTGASALAKGKLSALEGAHEGVPLLRGDRAILLRGPHGATASDEGSVRFDRSSGIDGRMVVLGKPGKVLVEVASQADDLLVVGAGARGRPLRALWPSVGRYCIARAGCPVLAVPPSPLHHTLDSVHRRTIWRLPLDVRELTDRAY
ncbi:universal stress protein [Streptomyces sioyaensis]|uniref:universal stress protein n=1 Tax=Streptomyces sioyaensis TaxID=67364 RepID=UPI0037B52430